MRVIFEWDARKARSNKNKHGVSFEEAKSLFFDPFLITFPDEEHSDFEEQYISIGYSIRGRVLLVVHTERGIEDKLVIRIISCRPATSSERRVYEEDEQ